MGRVVKSWFPLRSLLPNGQSQKLPLESCQSRDVGTGRSSKSVFNRCMLRSSAREWLQQATEMLNANKRRANRQTAEGDVALRAERGRDIQNTGLAQGQHTEREPGGTPHRSRKPTPPAS